MRETVQLQVFKATPARLPISRMRCLFELVVRRQRRTRLPGQINLVICSDAHIRALNSQFRGIDRATDVLSFNLDSTRGTDQVLGELYISAPFTRRQALRLGRRVYDEFLLLFCHGLLHLFGHDHDTVKRERAMFALQDKYLKALEGRR